MKMDWIIRYYNRLGEHQHDEIIRNKSEKEACFKVAENIKKGWTFTINSWAGK